MGHGRRLVFEVGGHLFAVEVSRVREALDLPPTTPLPGTPEWVLGLAHARGQLFAVVDFSGFLGTGVGGVSGLEETGAAVGDEEAPPCIVLEHGGRRLGIVVSIVMGVWDSLQGASEVPADSPLPPEVRPYVAALGKLDDDERPLWHLDVARVFADVYA